MKPALPASLLLSALASCVLPTIGIEPRLGPVNIDGDAGLSSTGVSANNSLSAMGIDDEGGAVSVRGDFQWASPHLSVALQTSNHDGSGRLTADLTQGGTTIPAGTAVNTDFDLGLNTAYLTFDLVPGDWELGLGLGLVALDLDLETTDTLGLLTVSSDESLPVPVLAVRAGGGLGPVDVEALLGFLTFAADGGEVTFVDLDVNGRLQLFGEGERARGSVVLGLRHTQLDAEYDDGADEVALDLTLSGPYVGFRLQL